MRDSLVRRIQLVVQWLGIGLVAYALASVTYATVYQKLESWQFDRSRTPDRANVRRIEGWSWGPKEGDVLGKIEIPRLGASVMVLQGTKGKTLATGAGHVLGSPLPGLPGNIAIAAHRDTFFRDLKDIQPDDEIRLATLNNTYAYRVRATAVVDPDDTEVISFHGRDELTLVTCYPFYYVGKAPKRFVVYAVPAEPSR